MKFYGGSTAYYGQAEADAFYLGAGVSALVPDTFTVSLGGRPYMIDLQQPFYRQYHRQVAPLIRTQADTSKEPGEHTMDPNGLWRRSFEDWSLGAGQRYLDRDTSVPNGFWQSKGIDALTNKWQISLQPDTAKTQTAAFSNLCSVNANNNLYIGYHQTVALWNGAGYLTVAGTPAANVTSITTDGATVYVCFAAAGIYTITAGATTCASYLTSGSIGASAVIGYVNGRLMLGNSGSGGDGKLYNITAGGAALPTPLLVPASGANTTWVGFAEGNSFLYGAAQVGGNSIIYGCTVMADGSTLAPPSVQGRLPNGESISAIYGYLGNLVIGSNLGVRFATASTTGIDLGSLISGQTSQTAYGPGSAVQCMAGYGRWVYFGWTNYDGTSTGLGRLDMENFVIQDDLPAFQSDLMATAQGAVLTVSVVPFPSLAFPAVPTIPGGQVFFGVSGVGFYTEVNNQYVTSGSITSGYILYDLVDQKIASLIDLQTLAEVVGGTVVGGILSGSVSVNLAADGGPFNNYALANSTALNPFTFSLPGLAGERFEVQLVITRDNVITGSSPVVTRWTLRSYPAPQRPLTWQLPLILDEKEGTRSGTEQGFDPMVEIKALEAMARSGRPVVFQEANEAYQVFVQDVEFLPEGLTSDNHWMNGIALVTLEGLPASGL